MSKKKLTDTELKKQELEAELSRIQGGIDEALDQVKTDVTNTVDPKEIIKKHPLPVVGAAFIIGALLGSAGGKSTPKRNGKGKDTSVKGMLFTELKRLAIKKGIDVLSKRIDNSLTSLKNEDEDSGD